VSFSVPAGQLVGLLGPNGAGKTTAMRAIMRLVALDAGSVTWDGRPVSDAVRQRFGYMPAERGMYPRMAVRDHLVYYARLSGLGDGPAGRTADAWLERLGLAERAGDTVQTLSSGNQQRVQLALALLGDPALLVLDEPFSGLDPVAVDVLSEVLLEQVARGTAVLLSSHQLDLVADVCSAVVIVDRGRVVLHGDVAQLRGASPVRFLDVEFATPTDWTFDGLAPGARVTVDDSGRRHRVELAAGTEPDALVASARTAGDVLTHRFGPPDLSEVFRRVVRP
jgi:ABC-2 type transport system ATP-binding protein